MQEEGLMCYFIIAALASFCFLAGGCGQASNTPSSSSTGTWSQTNSYGVKTVSGLPGLSFLSSYNLVQPTESSQRDGGYKEWLLFSGKRTDIKSVTAGKAVEIDVKSAVELINSRMSSGAVRVQNAKSAHVFQNVRSGKSYTLTSVETVTGQYVLIMTN